MNNFKLFTNNPTCPYCVKAQNLITSKGDFVKVMYVNREELLKIAPNATTVPQIMLKGDLIGGYEDLVTFYSYSTVVKKKKTVFNTENTGYKTGEYPLFFGEELGFKDTVNKPYPILEDLYQAQLGQIWNEFEIDLTQDRQDMLNADPASVELMVKTIMWQATTDDIASRSINSILMDYISNPDLENWYNIVAFFETIHSRTYHHIIKQTFLNPIQALEDANEDANIVKRSENLIRVFDDVINLPDDAHEEEKMEKVYLAIVALYMLESVNFMASFAITFGIAETGIFQGISQNVALICRDEMLHGYGGKKVMEIEIARRPELFKRIKPQMQGLFDAILHDEYNWTAYLFSEGRQCVGINKDLITEAVKFYAQDVGETLQLEYEKVEKNPLPYMETYIDTSKIQIANQEMQSGAYLVNSILAPTDLEGCLAELREEFLCPTM